MEPPPFGGGNYSVMLIGSPVSLPSMEPPPFGGGNLSHIDWFACLLVPSMEPPPFGGGNLPKPVSRTSRTGTFNGATPFRRWKLDNLRYIHAFVSFLQWSHPLSAVEIRIIAPATATPIPPSMEPPPFGGGNYLTRKLPPYRNLPSMEPPPFGGGNVDVHA